MANRYWVGNGGNWNDTAHWSTSTGGSSGASVPTSADNAIFDNLSFTLTAQTVLLNVGSGACLNFDWATVTNSPIFDFNSQPLNVYGSVTFSSGLVLTGSGAILLQSTVAGNTITTSGITLSCSITALGIGGAWTLQDNVSSTNYLNVRNGTFNLNNKDTIFLYAFLGGYTAGTINMGSGTMTIRAVSGIAWATSSTNFTFNCGTSTIKIIDTNGNSSTSFVGSGFTYYNVWFTGGTSSRWVVTDDNTFNDLKVDTYSNWLRFLSGTTNTFTTFTVNGGADALVKVSALSGTCNLVKSGGGTIICNYLDVSHIVATPASTWYALKSTDNNSVSPAGSGWIFISTQQAARDENRVPTLLAASTFDGVSPTKVYVNASSHRLKTANGTTGSDLGSGNASRDENRVPIAMAVSSADGVTPIPLYADDLHALLIKST
jgi:hypothetical protein